MSSNAARSPRRLVLRLIAPSGPVEKSRFLRGVAWLEEHCEVRFSKEVLSCQTYLAGSDSRRLAELTQALADPGVDALLCVRGGYGAMRLLKGLSAEVIRHANKPIIGFSDITALHLLWARAGVPSFHASMVGALGGALQTGEQVPFLNTLRWDWLPVLDSIRSEDVGLAPLTGLQRLSQISLPCEGELVGGNLSLIAAMAGSPYCPDFAGKVLFLEDIGESTYRIDRLLTSLRLRAVFDQIAGIVFGQFTDCPASGSRAVSRLFEEEFGNSELPIFVGAPCGHGAVNKPLAFGRRVRLGEGELHYI